jgi:hypothetical protein
MTMRRGATASSLSAVGQRPVSASTPAEKAARLGDDARLFALTFAAGFLFVSVYLA